MKLTPEHVFVLSNLAKVHQNLLIDDSQRLHSRSDDRTIYALVRLSEAAKFDRTGIGFYNLNQVTGTARLFADKTTGVDIKFDDHGAVLSAGKASAKILYAASSILVIPKAEIKTTEDDIAFSTVITAEQLDSLTKAAGVLGASNLAVEYEDGKGKVFVHDIKLGTSSNVYSVEMGESTDAKAITKLKLTYGIGNIHLMMNGYDYRFSILKNKALLVEAVIPEGNNSVIEAIKYVMAPEAPQSAQSAGFVVLE